MNYALFGCGSALDLFFEMEGQKVHNVVVIFDNNLSVGKSVNGIKIEVIENMEFYDFDRIMITSRHYTEIYNQLVLMGIEQNKIDIFLPLINF